MAPSCRFTVNVGSPEASLELSETCSELGRLMVATREGLARGLPNSQQERAKDGLNEFSWSIFLPNG